MNQLLAFPCFPATSNRDPNFPIAMGILGIHRAMLAVRGIDDERFPTPSELVRCSLLISAYDSLLAYGAVYHDPYRSVASRPSRAALLQALRAGDEDRIFDAYRRCVDDDGLPEIEKEWRDVLRLSGQE